jgi:hypothetical protein
VAARKETVPPVAARRPADRKCDRICLEMKEGGRSTDNHEIVFVKKAA